MSWSSAKRNRRRAAPSVKRTRTVPSSAGASSTCIAPRSNRAVAPAAAVGGGEHVLSGEVSQVAHPVGAGQEEGEVHGVEQQLQELVGGGCADLLDEPARQQLRRPFREN